MKEDESDIAERLLSRFLGTASSSVLEALASEGVECSRVVSLNEPGAFRNREIDENSRFLVSCDMGSYRQFIIYKVYVRAYLFFDHEQHLVDAIVVKLPEIG
ncbi:hypothetical protein E4656_20120 [Natronospirillum operosum]|uniref:Uncharacterized protein n=1 Tax=Natronospirillum operosum TaxID=2759953 RepID=A0A4Z0W8L3_9GAMM|nr:hypothetical protein [Natronospirillum operosum]TGG89364.1 hypothetical protein E4656_20120 [Natronospirillum operosum]